MLGLAFYQGFGRNTSNVSHLAIYLIHVATPVILCRHEGAEERATE